MRDSLTEMLVEERQCQSFWSLLGEIVFLTRSCIQKQLKLCFSILIFTVTS